MKLLNVIFTYNRYYLLRNTVESFWEFGPGGDLLIIDDGSEDPLVKKYLLDLKKEGVEVMSEIWSNESFHGGLYSNMNKAVSYAIQRNYTHIFFLQDDIQFMWHDEHFIERVESFFSQCSEASTITPIFFKGIVKDQMYLNTEVVTELKAWKLLAFGIIDIGIAPVEIFKDPSRRFGFSSEKKNSSHWRELGYNAYVMSAPILAWVPWPYGGLWRRGWAPTRSFPRKKYFLKPFTEEQIKKLNINPLDRLPFHEEYCKPWGWKCLSPYYFTGGRKGYLKLALKNLLKFQFPKIVGEDIKI